MTEQTLQEQITDMADIATVELFKQHNLDTTTSRMVDVIRQAYMRGALDIINMQLKKLDKTK